MLCQCFQCLTSGRFQQWVLNLVGTKTPKAGVDSQVVQKLEVWCCCLLPPVVLGDHGRMSAAGGTPVRRDQGLPMHNMAPVDPLQDMAEPISRTGGASGKMCSRKGRKYWTGRGGGRKKWETTGFNKAGGESAPGARTDTTAQGETMPEQTSLTRTVAHGKPCQSRGKMSGGGSSR